MAKNNLEGKSKEELQKLRDRLLISGKINPETVAQTLQRAIRILAEIGRRIDAGSW